MEICLPNDFDWKIGGVKSELFIDVVLKFSSLFHGEWTVLFFTLEICYEKISLISNINPPEIMDLFRSVVWIHSD